MRLDELSIGDQAQVVQVMDDVFRTKLMEMGVMQGTAICLMLKAPFNGPLAFSYDNTLLSIRLEDAKEIEVKKTRETA
jgi:Fe2+ transport system protein FeoA